MKKIMFNDRYGLTEAVLQGRKTVTRRTIIVPNWACDVTVGHDGAPIASDGNECTDRMRCERIKSPYKVGEMVAVAQRYEFVYSVKELRKLGFLHKKIAKNKMQVKSSLMPHQIRILDVRAERLQDITDEDCLREGLDHDGELPYIFDDKLAHRFYYDTPRKAFSALIDKISGKGTWERNPYVWRIEFELVK